MTLFTVWFSADGKEPDLRAWVSLSVLQQFSAFTGPLSSRLRLNCLF